MLTLMLADIMFYQVDNNGSYKLVQGIFTNLKVVKKKGLVAFFCRHC